MIGVGAAKPSAAGLGSCTGVRDGNGKRVEISTVCGDTTVSGDGPWALAYPVTTQAATNASVKPFRLRAEEILINDLRPIGIPSLRTCTFAARIEEGNGPEVSSSLITKATGSGSVSRE